MPAESGRVHLYTGNGKGKTTAALGLAMRMVGSGGKAMMIQFMKGRHYSELATCARFKGGLIIEQFGSPDLCVPENNDLPIHRSYAEQGLARAGEVISDPRYTLIVLDEIVTALFFTIVDIEEVFSLIDNRYPPQELVLTGRYAPSALVDRCDLVTEMREIRHYYSHGVEARVGIEM
jgi:cob(I)alamin adenosyltransferase